MYKRNPNVESHTRTHHHKRFPIPRGNSFYADAKRAEYIEKNLAKAENLYKKEIESGERKESAVKDLAVVYH
jgi:hypothetical protein